MYTAVEVFRRFVIFSYRFGNNIYMNHDSMKQQKYLQTYCLTHTKSAYTNDAVKRTKKCNNENQKFKLGKKHHKCLNGINTINTKSRMAYKTLI